MMAGLGAGAGPFVHGASRTGAVDIGWGGRLLGICAVGTMVTLGGNSVGVSSGTLREGSGQSGLKTTAGAERSSTVSEYVGVIAVMLEKMRESVWMASN